MVRPRTAPARGARVSRPASYPRARPAPLAALARPRVTLAAPAPLIARVFPFPVWIQLLIGAPLAGAYIVDALRRPRD